MTENSHEQLILHSLSPDLLRQYITFNDVYGLYLIKKNRSRAIEELDIHIENVRKNKNDIIGYSLLKNNLEDSTDNNVYILSGYDNKYGFDLYLNEAKTSTIGVAIIKLRQKSADELKWEKEILGIKHHKTGEDICESHHQSVVPTGAVITGLVKIHTLERKDAEKILYNLLKKTLKKQSDVDELMDLVKQNKHTIPMKEIMYKYDNMEKNTLSKKDQDDLDTLMHFYGP